jgi:regulation of enolase protein 1 (concanavalin A-like superfamily)
MNMFEDMEWLNEPPHWENGADSLTIETAAATDFWRETHYGFTRDSGHFLYREVEGDFVVTATVFGGFTSLYDQAGLMIRCDERTWVKAGVEYSDGALQLSTVITNGTSDWSLSPMEARRDAVTLRLTRQANAINVQYLEHPGAEGQWTSLRLGHLQINGLCQVGVMACSPERGDLHAGFTGFSIRPSAGIDLHS